MLASWLFYGLWVVDSFAALMGALGLPFGDDWALRIILPLGISFYTFQTVGYTVDVYRRTLPAERNFVDFALFAAFFQPSSPGRSSGQAPCCHRSAHRVPSSGTISVEVRCCACWG